MRSPHDWMAQLPGREYQLETRKRTGFGVFTFNDGCPRRLFNIGWRQVSSFRCSCYSATPPCRDPLSPLCNLSMQWPFVTPLWPLIDSSEPSVVLTPSPLQPCQIHLYLPLTSASGKYPQLPCRPLTPQSHGRVFLQIFSQIFSRVRVYYCLSRGI